MKQLVVEKNNPNPILLDTPIPKPGPGEVLIKNHYSVVSSGTELSAIELANMGVSEKLQNSSNIEKGFKLLKDDGTLYTMGYYKRCDLLELCSEYNVDVHNICADGQNLKTKTKKELYISESNSA